MKAPNKQTQALAERAIAKPRRHLLIPDAQIKPGVDTSHIDWAAQAVVEYLPDTIVVIGDWWDLPSLSRYDKPGGLKLEGARIQADIDVGNEAFERFVKPMEAEIKRRKRRGLEPWNPRRVFCKGNHEDRADRVAKNDAKFEGVISSDKLLTPGFERHEFLAIVEADGVSYSHYYANQGSGKPIGGSIENRLTKIGRSFVAGHEQGLAYSLKQYPGNVTRHGLVAGSFYLHDEEYRGPQSNGEWRGIVVLNEVRNGTYDIMPLSMSYLARKFG
jgi:hypothetical protein